MRLFSVIRVLFAISLILIPGCVNQRPEDVTIADSIDKSRYSLFEKNGVTFYYPTSAKISGSNIGLEETLAIFQLTKGNINVQKYSNPIDFGETDLSDEDCQSFSQDISAEFRLRFDIKDVDMISAKADKLGNLNACKFLYKAVFKGMRMGFTQYTAINGTNTYQVTYTEPLDKNEAYSAYVSEYTDLGVLVSTFEVSE